MISIKALTKQEYEKNHKTPSKIVFYKTEKDICEIISLHLAKNLKEGIEITEKFLFLEREADAYETENNGKILYIIKSSY